jgi:hypothetical protein
MAALRVFRKPEVQVSTDSDGRWASTMYQQRDRSADDRFGLRAG